MFCHRWFQNKNLCGASHHWMIEQGTILWDDINYIDTEEAEKTRGVFDEPENR